MSNQNVNPDIHTVKVNMSNAPRRHTYGPVEHAGGSVSPGGYNMEYQQSGRGTPKLSTKSDFVYVNSAYVGSVNSVNNINPPRTRNEPPTSVIREQYWTCSKWPFAQRALAIAVGVLLGTVISLVITLTLKGDDTDIRRIFQAQLAPR